MARIINVEAWEPEFPPLEIISGMKTTRMIAFSNSCSKNPIAVAVNISPIKRMLNQPALFFIICRIEVEGYVSSKASIPAILWISSVASSSATSNISSIVTIPTKTPVPSITGSAVRSYFLNISIAIS